MKKNILILGARGQLSEELIRVSTKHRVIAVGSDILDVTNTDELKQLIEKGWDVCINATAYTAVDKAEIEQELAYAVNATAVGNMAKFCQETDTEFFHISTDYVFAGDATEAYIETDPIAPINYYGKSKQAGEELALKYNPKTYIIRTSWVYSEFGNNFVKTMLRLAETHNNLTVVNDQIGSPTYARDLARTIFKIINSNQKDKYGIYHYTNTGKTNWAAFAQKIFDLKGLNISVTPIPSSDYPTPAKRPFFSLMNTEKIQKTFDIQIPRWETSLAELIEKL